MVGIRAGLGRGVGLLRGCLLQQHGGGLAAEEAFEPCHHVGVDLADAGFGE